MRFRCPRVGWCVLVGVVPLIAASCADDDEEMSAAGGSPAIAGERAMAKAGTSQGGLPTPAGGADPGAGAGGRELVEGGGTEGGSGGSSEPAPIEGNIEADELPDHGSVAFVLSGQRYALFKKS